MPAVARCLLLSFNILALASPPFFERWTGGGTRPFLLSTLLVLIVNAAIIIWWDRLAPRVTPGPARADIAASVATGLAGAIVIAFTAREWLHQILIFPHDPARADMLVVVQLGIRRLLQGGDPYAMYAVPWPITLPYGPVLWAPLVLPALAHADVRFATLIGFLFVPVACAIVAVAEAARGRRASAAAWLIVPCALAFSPDFRHFVSIGHTPAYWPLLALLAWLVAREHWFAAAITAGLLVVARTTLVAVPPVLLIAIWYRARPRIGVAALLLAASFALPFLPFAIWNWATLKYGLYGSYQEVIKGYVWTYTDWVQHTIGISGPLLARGWKHWVEIVQIGVMLGVYAICAVAIRAGRRPLPWMALALLAFSMTSLWPVIYLYFDVCLLLVCAALADTAWLRGRSVRIAWTGVLASSLAVLAVALWVMVPVNASIDAGTAADRGFLYSGFSCDERDGAITFAWVDGNRAEILIPRRSRSRAVIEIACRPNRPTRDTVQQVSAVLNGTVIGTVTLADGWQSVSFAAPERAWQIGVNELTLFLSSAVSPLESGLGGDPRRLSLAVDRLTVRTP